MSHFADQLVERIRSKGNPVLAGIDPRPDMLPEAITAKHGLGTHSAAALWARAVEEFCSRVLELVAPRVAAVKFQSAFFELYGPAGIDALRHCLAKATRRGLMTILDYKRSDISSTADAYAQAAFGTPDPFAQLPARGGADAVTLNPYLGKDSLASFRRHHPAKGSFLLVHTSNPGSNDIQRLGTDLGLPVFELVANWITEWNSSSLGIHGFGPVGSVVGATAEGQIALLRQRLPNSILLLPGYGAQGGTSAAIAAAFKSDGTGAIVNSSRGLVFPWGTNPAPEHWEQAILDQLDAMIHDLATNTPAGNL